MTKSDGLKFIGNVMAEGTRSSYSRRKVSNQSEELPD